MRKYMKRKMTFWIFALCFLLMLCPLTGAQKVWAGNSVITDFSRIFYIPAGAVLRGGSLEELKETYDSMSCMAYTEAGEELYLNVGRHEVRYREEKIELTRKEFELLQYLMENKGLVMTRNQILCHVWGYDFDGETRTVDVHVRTLRQKLGEAGSLIETVRGVGYRIGA